jgi:hypothetical protein
MHIARERKVVVLTIIAVSALSTVLWFAGVTSHAELPGLKEKKASAGETAMRSALPAADESTRVRANSDYGKLPLSFEVNQGQTDAQVKFLSRGVGYNLFLTSTEAVLSLEQSRAGQARGRGDNGSTGSGRATNDVLRMKLVGANPTPEIEGSDELPGKSNYFIGNNPKNWRVNVSTFGRVHYRGVYPGVDVVYYGNQRKLENDFIVAPGTNPSVIALGFDGASRISINRESSLVLSLAGGNVQLQKPVIYQLIDGARREVAGSYVMRNQREVGFEVGAYDLTKPLVIDPVLIYSFPLSGSTTDSPSAIAVDASGNAYISGFTRSANFPTASAMDSTIGGLQDVFIAKINPAGTALVYSTFLGGSGDDEGKDMTIDGAGNVYVIGRTFSSDFPTLNAFTSTFVGSTSGDGNAFVTRLNPAGSALVYSTFLSGQFGARGFAIATDGAGNAYVTGTTSINFPITAATAFDTTNSNSGFMAKLNTNGSGASSLVYSTYLGHTGSGEGRAIAADATGNVYVTGNLGATALNFASAGAFQTTYGGGTQDAFVEKFNTNLSGAASRVYSTYLGGSGQDFGGAAALGNGKAIAIDASGNAYITGQTQSTNFPTLNAFQPANGGPAGSSDAFLTKLNTTGSALIYSTYLGGNNTQPDEGRGVAVNAVGNAYVTGATNSVNFPTTTPPPTLSTTGGIFLTKFTPSGTQLAYSTRLVSGSGDIGVGVALDGAGNAFVTGSIGSDVFLNEIADPTIIGRVVDENGSPISTATVNLTGVPAATTTTDANGFFTFGLLTVANNYTVSVSVANYIFTAQAVNNLQKNVRLDFSPVVFTISGQVTNAGSGLGGVTMTLSDGKSLTTTTNGSGSYSFANLPAGRNYTVAPALVGFSFMPTSRSITNLLANQTADFAVAFEATLNSWTFQGRTYVYVKLSFPDSGFNVTDWGVPAKTNNDFSVNATVARLSGPSVQAVTTTAQIYDLGPLANGNYTFTFRSSSTTVRTLAFTVSSAVPPPNPIDDSRQFVKQQYRDFLNREADQAGEDFWTDNINKCNDPARRPPGQTVEQCILRQRETTSGAFFLSPEFQYTGYFVYRMYQGGLGRQPKLSEFIPDALFVGNGIVVNGQLSGAKINQNKAAFAALFVNCTDATRYRCAEFKAIYDPLNNTQYVDKLFQTTGVNASASDRAALVSGLNGGTETRATVLQKVVDGINVVAEGNQQFTTTYGQAFYDQQFNRAFVQLQYFGYMKRDPDDAGYAFWLGKLNQFGGNFVNAEMVLAFISSPEYRARFGQP